MAEYFLTRMRPWVPSAPPHPPNGVTVGLWPALSTYPASHDGPSTSPVKCPLTIINSTARRCLVCQLRKQAPRGSGGHKDQSQELILKSVLLTSQRRNMETWVPTVQRRWLHFLDTGQDGRRLLLFLKPFLRSPESPCSFLRELFFVDWSWCLTPVHDPLPTPELWDVCDLRLDHRGLGVCSSVVQHLLSMQKDLILNKI